MGSSKVVLFDASSRQRGREGRKVNLEVIASVLKLIRTVLR